MGRFSRYKMIIIYKIGKYDHKIMGIFILLKEYVKNLGGNPPAPLSVHPWILSQKVTLFHESFRKNSEIF